MKQYKSLLTIVALILLTSTVVSVELSPPASANPMMADELFGERAPPGITIYGNGTVAGTTSIAQKDDWTYTLTADISDSITIQRKGITLNGNGHTLRGKSDQTGIFMKAPYGVTITNLRIEGFAHGIRLAWQHYGDTNGRTITITGNTFRGNQYAISSSDHLQGSNITGNCFVGNTYCVSGFEGVNFRDNQFIDNEYCISDVGSVNNVDSSNMVNSKPFYYWIDQQNRTVPSDAGSVVLKNCKNITVIGLNITRSGGEVQLYNTTDSTIKGNLLSKSGISLQKSDNNTIEENKIVDCQHTAIYLRFSSGNRIAGNQIDGNMEGIRVEISSGDMISQNQVTKSSQAGICLYVSSPPLNGSDTPMLVTQNTISKNGIGIHNYCSNNATIALNNITDNLDWGMKLENNPKNNIIHHNNFIGNNVTGKLQVCITGFWMQVDNGSSVNGKYTPPRRDFVPGEANVWNNSLGGNFYSDYTARYTNATEVGRTGVGDIPYYINQNNIDGHPLMAPVDITDISLLSPDERPPDSAASAATLENLSLPVLLAIAFAVIVGTGLAALFYKRRS